MVMTAIQTNYAGCRFRSRLEARWAVFFDSLGIAWEFEKEGFELPSGRYLPDFWLSELEVWFEVKGTAPDHREVRLAHELSEQTQRMALIAYGTPEAGKPQIDANLISGHWLATDADAAGDDARNLYLVTEVGSYFSPKPLAHAEVSKSRDPHAFLSFRPIIPDWLHAAYAAARSARFEFGEQG